MDLNLGAPQEDGSIGASRGAWLRSLTVPLALDRREWITYFAGREIRVVTRGLLSAELHLDGRLRHRRLPWLAGRRLPALSAQLSTREAGTVVVEVFSLDPVASKIEIRAAGKRLPASRVSGAAGR